MKNLGWRQNKSCTFSFKWICFQMGCWLPIANTLHNVFISGAVHIWHCAHPDVILSFGQTPLCNIVIIGEDPPPLYLWYMDSPLIEVSNSNFRIHISCQHLPYQEMLIKIMRKDTTMTVCHVTKAWFWCPNGDSDDIFVNIFTVLASLWMPTGCGIICLRITAFYIPKNQTRRLIVRTWGNWGKFVGPPATILGLITVILRKET